MAFTEQSKPYRRGPGGIQDAAADVAKMLARGSKKKSGKKKKK